MFLYYSQLFFLFGFKFKTLKKSFTLKNLKRHFSWLNIILGLICVYFTVALRFIIIYGLNFSNTPNVWIISGFISLIFKLGIKGVVEDFLNNG